MINEIITLPLITHFKNVTNNHCQNHIWHDMTVISIENIIQWQCKESPETCLASSIPNMSVNETSVSYM